MLKALKSKNFWLNLLFVIGLLVINFIPTILFGFVLGIGQGNNFVWALVISGVFLVSVFVIVALALKRKLISFKLDFLTGKNIGLIFLAFLLMKIVSIVIGLFMTAVPENQEALNSMTAVTPVFLSGIMIAVAAPINEEIIFRGSLMQLFFKDKPWVALIVSTIIFALFHTPTNIPSFLLYGSMGAAMGLVYLKTGRIECSIALHFLNNGLGFLVMLLM